MRVITLAGSPRFPSRSSALLEYAREKLNALDVEVCHWNLHNFEPEDLLYARFDSPALKTLTEQLKEADGLIVATPIYKASFSGALKTLPDEEIDSIMAEDGEIDMHCDYCGTHYVFNSMDIAEIRNNASPADPQVH